MLPVFSCHFSFAMVLGFGEVQFGKLICPWNPHTVGAVVVMLFLAVISELCCSGDKAAGASKCRCSLPSLGLGLCGGREGGRCLFAALLSCRFGIGVAAMKDPSRSSTSPSIISEDVIINGHSHEDDNPFAEYMWMENEEEFNRQASHSLLSVASLSFVTSQLKGQGRGPPLAVLWRGSFRLPLWSDPREQTDPFLCQ